MCTHARARDCARVCVSVCFCVCVRLCVCVRTPAGHAQAVPARCHHRRPIPFYLLSCFALSQGFFSVIFFSNPPCAAPCTAAPDCGSHIYLLWSEFFNRGKLSVGLVTLPVFDPSAKKKKK